MFAPAYPVRVDGALDRHQSRWLWLVTWSLAIPHYVVAGAASRRVRRADDRPLPAVPARHGRDRPRQHAQPGRDARTLRHPLMGDE